MPSPQVLYKTQEYCMDYEHRDPASVTTS
jgi:hypothetical protein